MKTADQQIKRIEPRDTARFFSDVERLAETAVDTAEKLHARGLAELARPLERAVIRLGG